MEREHGWAPIDAVEVRQQRVVGRVDHCAPDPGAEPRDDQHPDRGRSAGHHREPRPQQRAGEGDGDAVSPVRSDRDGELHDECPDGGDRDERQDAGVRHAECVTDVGQEDAESGAVELVHGVEPEEDEQREDGAVADELLDGPARGLAPPPTTSADRSRPRADSRRSSQVTRSAALTSEPDRQVRSLRRRRHRWPRATWARVTRAGRGDRTSQRRLAGRRPCWSDPG